MLLAVGLVAYGLAINNRRDLLPHRKSHPHRRAGRLPPPPPLPRLLPFPHHQGKILRDRRHRRSPVRPHPRFLRRNICLPTHLHLDISWLNPLSGTDVYTVEEKNVSVNCKSTSDSLLFS